MKEISLVLGVGVNDLDYPVSYTDLDGKRKKYSWYSSWVSMLCRCYDPKSLRIKPTYAGCSVCDEWKSLSNFKNGLTIIT